MNEHKAFPLFTAFSDINENIFPTHLTKRHTKASGI